MATLALAAVGSAVGGSIGGSILGLSAATIGGMVGSAAGSLVDSWIVAGLQPDQKVQGQRLDTLRITSSAEGAVLPRVYGRMRMGGNIIWATDFREEIDRNETSGGKGGGPSVKTKNYSYFASFAVAICEGPIDPCPTPPPICSCPICSPARRRSMSPTTRHCACSTPWCRSPCWIGI